MIKARIRREILEDGESIPTADGQYLDVKSQFLTHQPDELDDCDYNTIALFRTGRVYLVKSIDLDFDDTLCWDDIEWLRAYAQYVQESHPQIDEFATARADEETRRD